jgi:Cu/Ag efflux protein CusF
MTLNGLRRWPRAMKRSQASYGLKGIARPVQSPTLPFPRDNESGDTRQRTQRKQMTNRRSSKKFNQDVERLKEKRRITFMQRLFTVFALAVFAVAICLGQAAPAKKSYTFHGKVQAVDESAKTLKVDGEKVAGWMDAMTMDYKIDDAAMLKKVKVGDMIMATVYEGDMMLHKVMVMPKATGDAESKK